MDQSRYFQKHLKKRPARSDFNLMKNINMSKEGMLPSGGGLVTCVRLGKGGSQRQTFVSLGRVHNLPILPGSLQCLLSLSSRLLCAVL